MIDEPSTNQATIMLISGELDKAIAAFEIAAGFAAMGVTVNLWFTLYGINCIKKPSGLFSYRKWFRGKAKNSPGRNPETDSFLQGIIRTLNHDGANQLPLSQLNYLGLGSRILNTVIKQKGAPTLQTLISDATDLGVKFKVCQPCVDILKLDTNEDLIVDVEVLSVSSYAIDAKKSHYNTTI